MVAGLCALAYGEEVVADEFVVGAAGAVEGDRGCFGGC